ncbi:hypothetical protein [Haloarcula laminariae]|uniref:hypothetical protein n=1 Tax=Haloarcula laminariae TaxID=2961577 RepID=UPI0021C74F90|nr:hypothetical protein [Halomicroarcula laminariae]
MARPAVGTLMGFLTALADATPLAVVVAVAATWAAPVGEALSLLVGPLAGLAALAAGTAVSLWFQTDERRFPLLRVVFELISVS